MKRQFLQFQNKILAFLTDYKSALQINVITMQWNNDGAALPKEQKILGELFNSNRSDSRCEQRQKLTGSFSRDSP